MHTYIHTYATYINMLNIHMMRMPAHAHACACQHVCAYRRAQASTAPPRTMARAASRPGRARAERPRWRATAGRKRRIHRTTR